MYCLFRYENNYYTATCDERSPVQVVALTFAEYNELKQSSQTPAASAQASGAGTVVPQQVTFPPLQLTPDEGARIAWAIVFVWAVGWAFRQLVIQLRNPGTQPDKEE